jgi:hypothetical protein
LKQEDAANSEHFSSIRGKFFFMTGPRRAVVAGVQAPKMIQYAAQPRVAARRRREWLFPD